MAEAKLELNGYTEVPDGKIAMVVTYLEMSEARLAPPVQDRTDVLLERWHRPDLDEYRKLFREVGEDWIWFGRLTQTDAALQALLAEPARENYIPKRNGEALGTLELNFADPENVEISYFGLVPKAIGGGLGRWLMSRALEIAWTRPQTRRVWLHTCTADSPQALGFYQSCGFKPYKRAVELADDPRLTGILPRHLGRHLPII
ncbi:N-acetyltransferase [Roseibium aquae]|uniref:N-acetyltransferase n=1 Tax=Roseibium aquae TaxID=1323746 RepID=A0A916T8Y5_9HYPH|nr:GNAT family N-acetyltransferase [Roseibium aquae]GGB34695.1 N-acetyltransferase [Roseibium aquae]